MGTVEGRMSLKQQVVLVLLVFLIDFSSSEQATCNPQNRECSCADTSSRDCEDFFPSERFHVDNIEECMDLCQALNPLRQCEWLLFHYSPAKKELSFIPPYLNCELFAPDDASLEQYVNTCDKQGQPTRRHDGSCTVNATNPSTGECNAGICPSGCAPCDQTDECHRKYHETECGMLSPAIRLEPNVPDFQFCLITLAHATALARDFVGDRQFNLGSPRMILTNVLLSLANRQRATHRIGNAPVQTPLPGTVRTSSHQRGSMWTRLRIAWSCVRRSTPLGSVNGCSSTT